MATKKGIYKILNAEGTYDTIYLKTDSSQVIESDSKQFVSSSEKNTWNNKANSGHKHTSNDITDATNANTANKIVKRDSNGNFSAGTITANLSGNASSSSKLATARKINGVNFDGTSDITITAAPTSHHHDDLYKRKTMDYKITPKLLADKQDLNQLYESGHYASDSDANSATILNRPPGNTGFSLEVRTIYGAENAAGRTIQIATMRISNDIYIRNKSENSSWTDWVKQWNESNLAFGTASNNMARGNHNHTSLTGVTNITFATETTDKASITTTIDGAHTYFDFKLGDDVGQNDSWRWRFAPSGASEFTAMMLDPITSTEVTLSVAGEIYAKGNKVYHVGNKPSLTELGAAAASHNHNSSNITALTDYAKPSETSAISTSDSLNAALGKLEKGLEGKKDASWVPKWTDITGRPNVFTPASHTHSSSDVKNMTGYVKGTATAAIASTDTLNAAISKLEVALDGKAATHNHPYRSNTWVPTWNEVTGKPTIISINDSSTTATNQTWSAKKINDSLAGKAASSHNHAVSEITGLGSAAKLNAGISANQVLKLDGNGKVPVSTLPSIAINETFTAKDQAEALTLKVEVGDIVIVTADAKTYICVNIEESVFDNKFKALSSGTDSITKVEVENLLKNKVDKENGKGLSTNDFTTTEKNKLNGIAIGANNYVHPDNANTRHVTDSEKSTWHSKAAGNHTHNSLLATDLANQTVSLNTFNLSSGSPQVAYYYCRTDGYGSNITGRPDDSAKYAFSLKVELVRWNGSSDYITKQTYTLGIHKITYVRYCNSGTWSTWEKMYTSSIKPTLTELGAAATSHNHTSLTGVTKIGGAGASCSWGSIDISGSKASWAGINFSDMGHSFLVNKDGYAGVWKNGGNAVFAFNESGALVNGTVGWDKITGKPSTLPPSAPHANSISGSNNTGVSTANDANKIWKSGFYETSNGTNYPSSGSWYWLIHAGHTSNNSGGSYQYGMQITAQNGTSNFYIRTTNNVGVGTWNKLYHTGNKPTLTELGITTLTRGSYLTGSNYNGTAATTWAVDATTTATANKVVARDANADVNARLFRSNYANGNTISGAIAFRVNNSNDDYIRFCSDTGAIRTFLNTYAKSETYTRSEMDSRYMQKSNVVFEDTISIKTPAA